MYRALFLAGVLLAIVILSTRCVVVFPVRF